MQDVVFIFDIGAIFKERNHGILEITGRYYKNIPRQCRNKIYTKRQKRYTYHCHVCGYDGDISEECLKYQNIGCSACSGRVPIVGKTDMWTTNPHLASMLANPDDGYRYTELSGQYVDWICPSCGNIVHRKSICNVNQHGLYCKACSDNSSYPNKFVSTLLSSLSIDYYSEHIFPWSKNLTNDPISNKKVYDFYLPKYNIVIEANGIQHYEECRMTKRTLQQEQQNDKIKKDLVLSHDMHFIEIDCRYSNPDFIINNMVKSGLFDLLNVSIDSIDLNVVKANAEKSYVVQCYHLWKNNVPIEQLMEMFHKSKTTIQNYIQKGTLIFKESEDKYG